MTVLFILTGVAFILLPFAPTLVEVLRKSDSKALKITDTLLKDPRSNPDLIFWHLAQVLNLEGLVKLAETVNVSQEKYLGDSILAVPSGSLGRLPKKVARAVCAGNLTLEAKTGYPSKLLGLKSITTGSQNALNEIHALNKLTLSANSKVIWWASGQEVEVQDLVSLPGKIQAKDQITFKARARFHLAEAPVIKAATGVSMTHEMDRDFGKLPYFKADMPHHVEPNTELESNMVIRSTLIVHKNAKIFGHVKAHKKIILEQGAQVYGNLVCMGDIELKGGNYVSGCLLSQKTALIGPQCKIGNALHQITCAAKIMKIQAPAQIHGVLRAWKTGEIG